MVLLLAVSAVVLAVVASFHINTDKEWRRTTAAILMYASGVLAGVAVCLQTLL